MKNFKNWTKLDKGYFIEKFVSELLSELIFLRCLFMTLSLTSEG